MAMQRWDGADWVFRQAICYFGWFFMINLANAIISRLVDWTVLTAILVTGTYMLAAGLLVVVLLRRVLPVRRLIIEQRGLVCPRCLFPLNGLDETGVCPECGRPYDFGALRRYWSKGVGRRIG